MTNLPTLSRRGEYAVRVNRKQTTSTPRPFMGTDETAEYLGVCRKTLLKLVKEGRIPFQRTGRKYIFFKKDVKRCFRQGGLSNPLEKAGGVDYDGR